MDEDMDSTKTKTTESNYYTRSSLSRGYQSRSIQSLKKGKVTAKTNEQLPTSSRKRRSVSQQQTSTKMEDCPVPAKFPKTMENTHCWNCHKPKDVYPCDKCPRSFHIHCIKKEWSPSWVCNFCARTESPLPAKTLCSYLKFVIQRLNTQDSDLISTLNAVKPSEVFFHMDWSIIGKTIKKNNYKCQEAFLADVKWIYHNVLAYYSDRPLLVSTVKAMLKVCQEELAEMDACHYCYKNTHTLKKNWFTIPCENNHILVWAKMKGFPFWPAKIMKINGDQADVRFFGGHERGLVPLEKCYLLSEKSPVSLKGKAKLNITNAMKEMKGYIHELRGVKKFHYFPFQTRYNAQLAAQQITPIQSEKDSSKKNETIQQESTWHKKSDQETDESINQASGNEFSEDVNQISSEIDSMEDANNQELNEDAEINSESIYMNADKACDVSDVNEPLGNDTSDFLSSDLYDDEALKTKKESKTELKKDIGASQILETNSVQNKTEIKPESNDSSSSFDIQIIEMPEKSENSYSGDINNSDENENIELEGNQEDSEEKNKDNTNPIGDNFDTSPNEDSCDEDKLPQDNLNLHYIEKEETCNSDIQLNPINSVDQNFEQINKEPDKGENSENSLFNETQTEEVIINLEILNSDPKSLKTSQECEIYEITNTEESGSIDAQSKMIFNNEQNSDGENVIEDGASDENMDNDILRIANYYTLRDNEDVDTDNQFDPNIRNSEETENSEIDKYREANTDELLINSHELNNYTESLEEDGKLNSNQESKNEFLNAQVEKGMDDSSKLTDETVSQEDAGLSEAEQIAQIYSKIKRGRSIMDSQKLHTLNKEVKLNFFNYFKKRNSVIRARPYFRLNSLYYPTGKEASKRQVENCFSEENILFNPKHKKTISSHLIKNSSEKALNIFDEAHKEELSLDSEGTELLESEDKLIEMEVNSIEESKGLKTGKHTSKESCTGETKNCKSNEEPNGKLKNISSLPTWLKSQFSITVVKDSSTSDNTELASISGENSRQLLSDSQNQSDSATLEEEQAEINSKLADPSKENSTPPSEDNKELSLDKNLSHQNLSDTSKLKSSVISKIKRTPLLKNREVSSPACEVTSTTITDTSAGTPQTLANAVVKSTDSTAVKPGPSLIKSDKTESAVKNSKDTSTSKSSKDTTSLEANKQWPKTTDQIQIIRLPFENSEPSTMSATKSRENTDATSLKQSSRTSSISNQPLSKSHQVSKISNKIRDQVKRTLDERSTPPQTKAARHANSYFEPYMTKINQTLQSTLESMYFDVQENLPLVRQLKAELEQINVKHKEELKDFAHARDMILSEMKASFELDKQRIISEMRHQFEIEKQKTVEETKKKQWCAVCGKVAMFYCCWNTSYCDYPCQRSHWPKHMETCTQTITAQNEAKKTDMLPPVTSANQMRPKERGHDDDIQVVIHNTPSRRPSDPSPRLMGASPHHSYYPSSMQMPPMVSNNFQYLSPNRQVAPPFITMGHSPMPPFTQSPHRMVSSSSRNSPMMNHPGNNSRLMMNGYPPYRTPYF